jgi:hypothetical protein
MTANWSIPSASATVAVSAATDATDRPRATVEPPYPGRSNDTQRNPSRSAAANNGSGGAPMFGVP